MRVVVISGKQGSGKTTLSEGLGRHAEKAGLTVSRLKFADPLYEMHGEIHKVLLKHGEDFKTPDGKLLQLLGTEWGRSTLGHDVWARILMRRILKLDDMFQDMRLVIVDDCRFRNELEAFRILSASDNAKVLTVRLEAGEALRRARAEKWRENTTHPSEIDLDGCAFDMTINAEENAAAEVLEKVLAGLRTL